MKTISHTHPVVRHRIAMVDNTTQIDQADDVITTTDARAESTLHPAREGQNGPTVEDQGCQLLASDRHRHEQLVRLAQEVEIAKVGMAIH